MMNNLNWPEHLQSLHENGYVLIPQVLSQSECDHLRNLYHEPHLYRSIISMKRYRFGEGEYKYFQYPLPPAIQLLREQLYSPLAALANQWMQLLSIDKYFPPTHAELKKQCHLHDQTRPTPLILRYTSGGFNTLHQDLYGEVYFPFQAVIVLTQKDIDHEGGELVLTEQVPRAQSKAEVIAPNRGDLLIFTTNFRPMKGTRGYYRVNMKHGVSKIKSGERYALGIIFHDAK